MSFLGCLAPGVHFVAILCRYRRAGRDPPPDQHSWTPAVTSGRQWTIESRTADFMSHPGRTLRAMAYVRRRVLADGSKRYECCWRDAITRQERSKSFARKADADAFGKLVDADQLRGVNVPAPSDGLKTVAQVVGRWYSVHSPTLKPKTAHSYANLITSRILPALRALPAEWRSKWIGTSTPVALQAGSHTWRRHHEYRSGAPRVPRTARCSPAARPSPAAPRAGRPGGRGSGSSGQLWRPTGGAEELHGTRVSGVQHRRVRPRLCGRPERRCRPSERLQGALPRDVDHGHVDRGAGCSRDRRGIGNRSGGVVTARPACS